MGPKKQRVHISRWHYGRVCALGAVFQLAFLKHVKYFILSCIECELLWSIVDTSLYLTLWDCSPSCFDPVYLLLAYLWAGLSWSGCISTIKCFHHQKQAAETLHQQQAAGEAHQKHSAENTIKRSGSRGRQSLRTGSNPMPYTQCAEYCPEQEGRIWTQRRRTPT